MAKLNKKQAQVKHFRRRMAQRYGLYVTKEDLKGIVKQIQNNESEPVFVQSQTRVLHAVEVQGERVIVVYDKSRGVPVTVIPPEGAEQYENGDEDVD